MTYSGKTSLTKKDYKFDPAIATVGAHIWEEDSSLCKISRVLYVDGFQSPPPATPDGSMCAPFPTIQAALNFINALPAFLGPEMWTLLIASGEYAEDITIPAKNDLSVRLVPFGVVFLTGATGVTWNLPAAGAGSKLVFDGEFVITGATGIAINSGPVSPGGTLESWVSSPGSGFRIATGGIELAGLGASTIPVSIFLRGAYVNSSINATPTHAVDIAAIDSVFQANVNVRRYERMEFCTFGGNINTTAAMFGGRTGFYSCEFGLITINGSIATTCRMDSVSVQSMHEAGVLFGPGVTLFRVDDAMDKSVVVPGALIIADNTGIRHFFCTAATAQTITLPASTNCHVDDEFTIKDMSGARTPLNVITVAAAGGDLIDGAASFLIATPYGACQVKYTGIPGNAWAVI